MGGGAGGEVGDCGKQIIYFRSVTVLCDGRYIQGRIPSLMKYHTLIDSYPPQWGLQRTIWVEDPS